jgi:alkanesulfonate monooxygenase SsuD/methylene tetrahydromethanopterin reductase-like flavin-dependent oxidoreductase (luciferase family)
MDIGIGLPSTLTIAGPTVVDWARTAEQRGFSTLGTVDRLVYPNYDPLTTLAVAAGATSRIGLFTDILLTPLYQPVRLAKVTSSLDALSGGRLTLGLGVGGRADDFAAAEVPFGRRGKIMDEMLDLLHRAWAGEPVTGDDTAVGPAPAGGNRITVLMGGTADVTIERTVRYAEGWTAGGGGPAMAAPMAEKIRKAWSDAGREGEPKFSGLVYFGLSDEQQSRASLQSYYGFLGDWTAQIVEGALRTPDAIRSTIAGFADIGFSEVVLFPTVPDLDEVNRLADVVF